MHSYHKKNQNAFTKALSALGISFAVLAVLLLCAGAISYTVKNPVGISAPLAIGAFVISAAISGFFESRLGGYSTLSVFLSSLMLVLIMLIIGIIMGGGRMGGGALINYAAYVVCAVLFSYLGARHKTKRGYRIPRR